MHCKAGRRGAVSADQIFVVLVSGLILVVVLGAYFRQKLAIRWQEGMTEQILQPLAVAAEPPLPAAPDRPRAG